MDNPSPNPELSIIVCVYNEEKNVKPLILAIFESLREIDFELIYVDDGSTDQTVNEVKTFDDPRIHLIELKKNYGQSTALSAGIDYAHGEFIVLLDGDLQNDPLDIPAMLCLAKEEDWDLIAGIRAKRQDGMFFRKIPSKIANAIIRKTTGVRIKDYGCTLKLFRSEIAKKIGLYGELHRFIPVLAAFEGARITQIDVRHHARIHGQSKYGLGRTLRVISDLILMVFFKKYMQKPMHLFGGAGLGVFLAGALIELYLLVLKIMGEDIWGKPLLILGTILIIAGIQLITVGLILEMQTRTYYESQQKKPYNIKRIWRKS
jgi:glycosyltransferase involved in cell wall biosynthesis